ncbi:hypothetical protein [Roseomonas populi]|uniref:DUF1772 domain-containing protein n=1 Tax=Roseomonas populi TaxID=3121582 RepID=A0ABT1X5J5_9PROT|nr:hypothetical protein [Roseomonas pecuniae]MCR0982234.1 hypothetical protein [Roseomonas pecuniae]
MLVNLPFTLGALALVVLIARLASLILPPDLYFTFESFLFEKTAELRYYALALKLAAPVAAGFLVVALPVWLAGDGGPVRRRQLRALHPSLFVAGSAAAFLMAWPFILYWDVFAAPAVREQKPAFLMAYLFYFAAFGYFCLLGGNLAQLLLRRRMPASMVAFAERNVTWADSLRLAVLGSFTTIVATAIADLLGKAG